MSFSSILETAQWVFQIVKLNSSIQEHHIVFLTANHSIIRNILVTFVLIALSYFFLRNNQNTKTNWAVFYASLYMVVMLFFTNYMCADLGLWQFTVSKIPSLHIPPDLYFIWIFFWGVLPVLFFKGRHLFLIAISLFWIDICTMPVLQDIGLIKFNSYWILGELSLIAIVFVPGYFWAYCSYNNKYLGLRSILQVITIGTATILGIPLLLNAYGLLPNLSFEWSSIEFQILFIVVFPALAAVNDLVTKGDGTPFPFDPTKKLVRTGVYAYCKNPIQWSYTLLFIVLSISYSSFYFLIGFIVSILFVICSNSKIEAFHWL